MVELSLNVQSMKSELRSFSFLELHFSNEDDFKNIIAHQTRLEKLFSLFVGFNMKLAKQPRNDLWSEDEVSLIFMLQYLWFIEGGFSFIINWIIYTLIMCNGFELPYKYRRIVVTNIYDLNKVTLFDRLKLISDNGFSNLARLIDTRIRNSIAHVTYEIQSDGFITFLDRNNEKICDKTKDEMLKCITEIQDVYKEFNVIVHNQIESAKSREENP